MSCDGGKWECEYCTYNNWPSAIRCTMCRSVKPVKLIEDGISSEVQTNQEEWSASGKSSLVIDTSVERKETTGEFGAVGLGRVDSELPPAEVSQGGLIGSSSKASAKNVLNATQNRKSSNSLKILDDSEKSPEGADGGVGIHDGNNLLSWSCRACTFLNPDFLNTCLQCSTSKNSLPTPPPEQSTLTPSPCKESRKLWNDMKILKISEESSNKFGSSLIESFESTTSNNSLPVNRLNERGVGGESPVLGCAGVGGSEVIPVGSQSACESVYPEGASKVVNNPIQSNVNEQKWSCAMCTYDNWPRSVKCIMCGSSQTETENEAISLSTSFTGNNRASHVKAQIAKSKRYARELQTDSLYHENIDSLFLEACRGVVEGKIEAVEEFLAAGGNPARQLTLTEVEILARPSAFDVGFTLVHLALRFHQEHVLATVLSQVDDSSPVVKRVPPLSAPTIALDIKRHALSSIRSRKGNFQCQHSIEITTFTLPAEIDDLPSEVQDTLFEEMLDKDVQKELEEGQIINWSDELTDTLNSRLYALWNRSAGDCLLDSVFQTTWGIFDHDGGLRRVLYESLNESSNMFYQRWKESEILLAGLLNFSLNETQCMNDFTKLLSIAGKQGSSLEQIHIFVLAHILRRPIIVYGVKYVKSYRGDNLGYARYEGIYLPFFWDHSFCWKWPIALGYTRGHFSALVPIEPECDPLSRLSTAAQLEPDDVSSRSTYLPLINYQGDMLPIHFLSESQMGKEELIMSEWLDLCYTDRGIMVARQCIPKRPVLVSQMMDEWMKHYRRMCSEGPQPGYLRQATTVSVCYSSDGDSEND